MIKGAKITNGIVEAIEIVNDGELKNYPNLVDVTNIKIGIGWLDNNDGTFTAPADAPEQEYKTIMSKDEFLAQLTGSEFDLFLESNDVILKKINKRFAHANRIVDIDSSEFDAVMLAAVADGIFTLERAKELRKGFMI